MKKFKKRSKFYKKKLYSKLPCVLTASVQKLDANDTKVLAPRIDAFVLTQRGLCILAPRVGVCSTGSNAQRS